MAFFFGNGGGFPFGAHMDDDDEDDMRKETFQMTRVLIEISYRWFPRNGWHGWWCKTQERDR